MTCVNLRQVDNFHPIVLQLLMGLFSVCRFFVYCTKFQSEKTHQRAKQLWVDGFLHVSSYHIRRLQNSSALFFPHLCYNCKDILSPPLRKTYINTTLVTELEQIKAKQVQSELHHIGYLLKLPEVRCIFSNKNAKNKSVINWQNFPRNNRKTGRFFCFWIINFFDCSASEQISRQLY